MHSIEKNDCSPYAGGVDWLTKKIISLKTQVKLMPSKYPVSMRILHWLMALAIFGLIGSGWYMAGLPDEAANKYDLYPLHKSFGALIIMLFALRLALRLSSQIPELPLALANWEVKLSHLTHGLIYGLMLAVPVSGYVMSGAYEHGHGIDFFWTKLPDLVPKNETLFQAAHAAHDVLPYLLLGVLSLHIAGAIKHRWFDPAGADVLPRML